MSSSCEIDALGPAMTNTSLCVSSRGMVRVFRLGTTTVTTERMDCSVRPYFPLKSFCARHAVWSILYPCAARIRQEAMILPVTLANKQQQIPAGQNLEKMSAGLLN